MNRHKLFQQFALFSACCLHSVCLREYAGDAATDPSNFTLFPGTFITNNQSEYLEIFCELEIPPTNSSTHSQV